VLKYRFGKLTDLKFKEFLNFLSFENSKAEQKKKIQNIEKYISELEDYWYTGKV
jgi:hypothetical protein